jgi:putative hydrolase of the HAD superfamily
MGTLVALEPPWQPLAAELRLRHGLTVTPQEAERAMRAEISFYRAHHHEARDERALATLRERCAYALYAALPSQIARAVTPTELLPTMLASLRFTAYPDAAPALTALRALGLKLVAVSNWDISLKGVLAETGLGGLLDGIVTSAQAGHPKPATAVFEMALTLAGVGPGEAVHVGDSLEHDVLGARAAGVTPVLIRREQDESSLAERPVVVISKLTDLLDMQCFVSDGALSVPR